MEEFDSVDTTTWPIHQRWRVINACLAAGLLRLSEVLDGYKLELLEVPEVEAEEDGGNGSPDSAA